MSADSQAMLTAAQVAALYGVDPKTVTKWEKAGRVIAVPTPGGHRRYPSGQFVAAYEARRLALEAGTS